MSPQHPNISKFIGHKLYEARKSQKLTLAFVGRKLNVSAQQIHKYESGENRISAMTLYHYADVLSLNIGYFFPVQSLNCNQQLSGPPISIQVKIPHKSDWKLIPDHFTKEMAATFYAKCPQIADKGREFPLDAALAAAPDHSNEHTNIEKWAHVPVPFTENMVEAFFLASNGKGFDLNRSLTAALNETPDPEAAPNG